MYSDEHATKELAKITARHYEVALSRIALSKIDLALLRHNFLAKHRMITAKQMARKLKLGYFGTANCLYANLARKIAKQIDVYPPFAVLLVLVEMKDHRGECGWVLREKVAKAIDSLGLVASRVRQ